MRKGDHHLLPVGARCRGGHCFWGYDSPGHATPAADLRKGPVPAEKISLCCDHLQNTWEVEGFRAACCSRSSCRPLPACTATQVQTPFTTSLQRCSLRSALLQVMHVDPQKRSLYPNLRLKADTCAGRSVS